MRTFLVDNDRVKGLIRAHDTDGVARAGRRGRGFTLWPTEIFTDGVPDPRNDVHYDLIVAAGPNLIPSTLITGTPVERRAARVELAPRFERVLAVLGEARGLDGA